MVFLLPSSKGPCSVLLKGRTSTCQEDRKAKGGQYLPHLTWGLKIWLKTKVLSARHKRAGARAELAISVLLI